MAFGSGWRSPKFSAGDEAARRRTEGDLETRPVQTRLSLLPTDLASRAERLYENEGIATGVREQLKEAKNE